MEKLLIKSNGQWELTKAKPVLPNNANGLYDLDSSKPGKRYTGKDLADQQRMAVDYSKKYHGSIVKDMKNEETGQTEPHIVLHRGLVTPYEHPKNGQENRIKWNHRNNTVTMGTDSVHTSSIEAAHNFVNQSLFSFWVPQSKIHAGPNHHDHIGSDSFAAAQADDHAHVSIKLGSYKHITLEEAGKHFSAEDYDKEWHPMNSIKKNQP